MDWIANPSTGKKRPPSAEGDDDLITEQPLSKKLAKLSLQMEEESRNRREKQVQKMRKPARPVDDERMEVDNDNPNVVFINDIDDELDSDDYDDEDNNKKKLIFVPDIEKRLTRIPYALARSGNNTVSESSKSSTALVLYTVPSSLSVSKDQDNVRRAIIEARARIRQKQLDDAKQQGQVETGQLVVNNGGVGVDSALGEGQDDPDAMDIE